MKVGDKFVVINNQIFDKHYIRIGSKGTVLDIGDRFMKLEINHVTQIAWVKTIHKYVEFI